MKENEKEKIISIFKDKNFDYNFKNPDTLICDFKDYNDFYFNKLQKNGIDIQNNEIKLNCDIDYFLKLFEKKDLLIFDLDGVVFDVSKSYMKTISKTYKHFSNSDISLNEILKIKSKSGMNCDWNVVQYLLKENKINIELDKIGEIFQNYFYNPEIKDENKIKGFLINQEKLLISKDIFEKLTKNFDMVVFSGRLRYEVDYSFKKFDIGKYFYYFITCDCLPSNMLKPHPMGVNEILKHCPHKKVKYLGDSVDDIKAGNQAGVETIGIVPPNADVKNNIEDKIKAFKKEGAKYIIEDITKICEFL